MTIESKSILARLLAEENLTINVDGSAKTAYFNLNNRSITIPNWQDASPELYDLLLGHEVGHARNTPAEGWHDNVKGFGAQFKSFLNVCEDARIEKKMLRKYPGLRRSFLKAYAELFQNDFFGIKGRDLKKLLLIDRINLACKLGSLSNLFFMGEEKVLHDRVVKAETWDDVVAVAKDLFEYCKKEKEEKKEEKKEEEFESDDDEGNQTLQFDDGDDENEDEDDEAEDSSEEESEDDSEEEPNGFSSTDESDDESDDDKEPESITDNNFRKNESKLASVGHLRVFTLPNDIMDVVIPYSEVLAALKESNSLLVTLNPEKKKKNFAELNVDFITRNRNAIDQFIKEFQMKKSATQWKKVRISNTGDIDASRLSRYRISDDIFKSRAILPQGKNHGMVLLLDLSSSMRMMIKRTIEHTLVLATVCKRVGIPFIVYGFTESNILQSRANKNPVDDELMLSGRVLELLSSSMKNHEYHDAFGWLLSYGYTIDCYTNYNFSSPSFGTINIPSIMEMGSTPTSTALAAMIKILPQFQQKFNLEKTSLVVMTDGQADYVNKFYYTSKDTNAMNLGSMWAASDTNYQLKLGVNKPKRIYKNDLVHLLNEYIRNELNVEVFGFFITSRKATKRRDLPQLRSMAIDENGVCFGELALEKWKQEGYFETHYARYSRFWVVNIDEGETIEVEKSMTVSKKAKAFAQNNKIKKMNRVIATKFMELAA